MSAWGRRRGLVRPVGILGPLQLNLEPLHADLEPVHGLNRCLGRVRVVERHESWKQINILSKQFRDKAVSIWTGLCLSKIPYKVTSVGTLKK